MSEQTLLRVLLVLLAPLVGSFLAVVSLRLPRGKTFVRGRSECDACGRTLAMRDLVPLASFVLLRGRCRYCRGPIDPLHPILEVGALIVAIWAGAVTEGWVLAATCVFGWFLLALAAIDARHYLLPDKLTFPLLLMGIAVAWQTPGTSIANHLIGAAAGYLCLAGLGWAYRAYRHREGLGLGDAKFFAAIGAWVTWEGLPLVLLVAALTGLTTVLLASLSGRRLTATTKLPFGPYLAAAAWLVWLYGPVQTF